MKQVIDRVVDSILDSGLVEVEVSARHVHLTQEDVEKLFGKGAVLHEKRALSQKGQYLSEERVTIIGPKGRMERVAVLGPVRKATQVDLRGAGDIVIEGPEGTLDAKGSVIVARAHVHVPPEVALRLKLQDKERVSVQIISERPVTFDNVVIRVNSEFRFKMHIDFDEANAALVSGFTLGKIIRQERQ